MRPSCFLDPMCCSSRYLAHGLPATQSSKRSKENSLKSMQRWKQKDDDKQQQRLRQQQMLRQQQQNRVFFAAGGQPPAASMQRMRSNLSKELRRRSEVSKAWTISTEQWGRWQPGHFFLGIDSNTGWWWFGTFFIFLHILGKIAPTDELHHHQPEIDSVKYLFNPLKSQL